jgi:hypothetical protein
MSTVTLCMPWSIARRAASSAATWAAKGVLFREPLNPRRPHVDHDTALPFGSVIVTIVLLKVDWMCTTPVGMFFLTFFFVRFEPFAMTVLRPRVRYFFFLMAVRRGPFRVRAFV